MNNLFNRKEKMDNRRKDFNQYKVVGDYVILYLDKRNGDVFEGLVSRKHLDRLIRLNWHWTASWQKNTRSYYATHTEYVGGDGSKPRTITHFLHRLVTNTTRGDGTKVDHIDHKTLDCRDENLRVTDNQTNVTNRSGANRNSTSGFRNVHWIGGWWVVQFWKNGKTHRVGKSKDRLEAGKLANQLRPKYYGE